MSSAIEPHQPTSTDWEAVFRDVRLGLVSKGEICRRYGVTRSRLEDQLARNGITADLNSAAIESIKARLPTALMTDETIVSDATDRSVALIKGHLTLARGLHARLAELIQQYDQIFAPGTEIDEKGEPIVDAKKWMAASILLDNITKIAERISGMEMRTLHPTLVQVTTMTGPGNVGVEIAKTNDPIEAARAYTKMINGS
jgi:hypothetical protein